MDQPISRASVKRRQRTKLLLLLSGIATFGVAVWGIDRAVSPSVALADIVVAQVRLGDVANTINASGVVVAMHEEQVTSPIQTRVAKVHAKAGQAVVAGELLLTLDQHSLQLAVDSLEEQSAQQENKIVGLTLEMDQKRKQLSSSIELLELDLKTARVKWGRYQVFKDSGIVAKDDLLTAELNVQRLEIQLRQQRELIEDNRRSTSSSVEAARLQKTILQKQLAQQQQLLAQAQVRAPFAGVLTWLLADEGASVNAGQLVAKVSEQSNYGVEASLSDFHARSLSPGQLVRVEQGNQGLAGRVQTILPEIQNGTVKLLVALDQADHPMLRNKLRVEVHIVTEQKTDVLVANQGVAFNGRGRQSLFLLKDGVARKTELDVGASDGKVVELVAGAREGDSIITSDLSRFKDRDHFRVSQ